MRTWSDRLKISVARRDGMAAERWSMREVAEAILLAESVRQGSAMQPVESFRF